MGNEGGKENQNFGFGLRLLGVDSNSALLNKVALYEDFIVAIGDCRELRYVERSQDWFKPGEEKTRI